MCNFRNLLVLLLCLVIPMQGVAAVVMAAAECPMVKQMAKEHPVSHEHGGCDEAEPATNTNGGKVCKVGHECPCGGQYVSVSLALQSFAPVADVKHLSQLDFLLFSFPPASVWRPPIEL